VVNNAGLTGVLSDSARQEVMSLNPASANLTQIYSVAEVLQQDMKNRMDSFDDQIDDLRDRIKAVGSNGTPPLPKLNSQGAGATVKMRAPNGQEKDVPADQVDHYKSKGATVVQ